MRRIDYTTYADNILWGKVCAGDNQAYTYIYRKYVQHLFSFGLRFSSDEELVKDCIQEVFVRIYQNRSTLGSTNNIRFYLYLALKNELLQNFRKDSKYKKVGFDQLSFISEYTCDNGYIQAGEAVSESEAISAMLNSLPDRQKEIMYYRYIEELSFDEICQIMNLNYQSAQNLIQRSLKKLRILFTDKTLLIAATLFFLFFI